MHDVFISYSRDDRPKAEAIQTALEDKNRTAFIDQAIEPGVRWTDTIRAELESAQVVIVLWSEHSVESIWVLGEAAKAAQLGTLLPVQLDGAALPAPFEQLQCSSLIGWDGAGDHPSLMGLLKRLDEKLGTSPTYGIKPVEPGEAIDHHHLQLIDTTWRYPEKDREFNDRRKYYHLHIILFGHRSALDRVERVIYYLPEWPQTGDALNGRIKDRRDRDECFRHRELANGYSVVQAEVHLADQPDASRRVVRLSRFVIPSNEGPRLDPLILEAKSSPEASRR